MKLKIALGQMDIKLGEPRANLVQAAQLAGVAAERGAELLVLPELWSTGYDLERAAEHAQPVGEGIWAGAAALAQTHGLFIIGSCLADLGEGRYGNTAVVFAPDGSLLGSYTKIHLFGLMDEDQYLTAGDALALLELPWGLTALAICYDLRFPELWRAYALLGASMVVLPSEWPQPRLAHWRTLLRARAIENQCFVIACNRVGTSKGQTFFGHSTIVDPWGETVLEMGEEAGVATAVVDLDLVADVRARIPVFADRRPEVYRVGER